ncbi:MAG: oxidoreductase [Candidatus Binatia bacterium]
MASSQQWQAEHVPDQTGKIVIVTGANSGTGYEAAKVLAGKGARIVLACRSREKAEVALRDIQTAHPAAPVEVIELDLASLASIRAFADAFHSRYQALHILLNNAGVMALPYRRTVDGFEMQFGTNHLGHFALTGLLLAPLLATERARVVTVSSTVHQIGRIRFDDPQGERRYQRWLAYGQSKLANLLFTYELQRRFAARGINAISVAAHPGYAATNMQFASARLEGPSFQTRILGLTNRFMAQSAAMGALPLLYACTASAVQGGDYIGPDGFMEQWGYPKKVSSNRRSHDTEVAARLWDVSEDLTGVKFAPLEN